MHFTGTKYSPWHISIRNKTVCATDQAAMSYGLPLKRCNLMSPKWVYFMGIYFANVGCPTEQFRNHKKT